jgi:hypothetical protein
MSFSPLFVIQEKQEYALRGMAYKQVMNIKVC